jgi:DNA-binding response OmpR family regulator
MGRILIVEDNADQLRMLREAFSADHTVEIARLAEDGIELARSFRPHVAILDVHLPAMNGVEAGRWLKQEHGDAGIRILVLTALSSASDIQSIIDSGCCDAFLAKPAPLMTVRRAVAELLESHGHAA